MGTVCTTLPPGTTTSTSAQYSDSASWEWEKETWFSFLATWPTRPRKPFCWTRSRTSMPVVGSCSILNCVRPQSGWEESLPCMRNRAVAKELKSLFKAVSWNCTKLTGPSIGKNSLKILRRESLRLLFASFAALASETVMTSKATRPSNRIAWASSPSASNQASLVLFNAWTTTRICEPSRSLTGTQRVVLVLPSWTASDAEL
mmetsp:Transcript_2383/g.6393  ORF Transcript_2383/g.6393 Transcript_2383/m.6393 type:complete len:203 (-) Transcript_2383:214-822(-)